MKHKKIYLDMMLNLAAAGVPLVVLQIVLYPLMAKILDSSTYGLMIAIYSLLLLVSDSLGKSVNNERLIVADEKASMSGDYNVIIMIYQIVNLIIITIAAACYIDNMTKLVLGLIALTGCCMLINAYLIVYYRIRLNYLAIVINGIILSAGFLIGYLIFYHTGVWLSVFACGQFSCTVFLIASTKLFGEPFRRTGRFKKVFSDSTFLALSLFLAQGMNLIDKLILFPLLGGAALAIYYTASLVGKILSIATGPVNSVILSYLSKVDRLSKNLFKKYIIICLSFCTILAILILIVSRPVLGFLFPQYVDDAMVIVPFTTASIFFQVMSSMVTPIVMRYCDASWQTVINGISFLVYILMSVLLYHFFDLIGFCIGIGASQAIRFFTLLIVYEKKGLSE